MDSAGAGHSGSRFGTAPQGLVVATGADALAVTNRSSPESGKPPQA